MPPPTIMSGQALILSFFYDERHNAAECGRMRLMANRKDARLKVMNQPLKAAADSGCARLGKEHAGQGGPAADRDVGSKDPRT